MLLGYVTNGLRDHRLDDALRLLADHGYRAVGLTLDVGHLDPYRASAAAIDAVAALCARFDFHVVIETGARFLLDPRQKHEPTLMTRDPAARDRRLDFYRRAARIGRTLGAHAVSFWSGVDRSPGPDSQAWLDDGVRRACESIVAEGLVPSLEPEPGMAIDSLAAFDALCDRLGSAAPRLTLDVGHLYVTNEGDPVELAERYASRCAQVQLEDMRRGVHEHLPPGSGDVDFHGVLGALRGAGYAAGVCFELSRSSHEAVRWISACADLFRAGPGPQRHPHG